MKTKSLFILGRQPAIGRAELESLFGADNIATLGERSVACSVPFEDVPFARLGGAVRLAKPLAEITSTKWPEIAHYLSRELPKLLKDLPEEGKVKLGLSAFGLPINARQLLRTGLDLKKICKQSGRSMRLVPNEELELSSAQVLHNQLTGALGIELLLVQNTNKTWLAQTVAVQDINAYAKRDQGRPKRDARVGMLPPKLAQIIVNLATGPLSPTPEHIVLDPFCGTGVVLQEASLAGYGVYGTDLEPRMVEFTTHNLNWLTDMQTVNVTALEAGDATDHQWQPGFATVACETYLGRPLSSWPNPETLQDIIGTCNLIVEKFMRNIGGQIPSGFRLCLGVPAWKAPNGRVYHLPLLDRLDDLGYNRVSFEHSSSQELIYARPDQLVARELLVITRK
jgi:tRNA G10  N-methylase Trm11